MTVFDDSSFDYFDDIAKHADVANDILQKCSRKDQRMNSSDDAGNETKVADESSFRCSDDGNSQADKSNNETIVVDESSFRCYNDGKNQANKSDDMLHKMSCKKHWLLHERSKKI